MMMNLKEELRELIAEIAEKDEIPDDVTFKDLGIDSMMGVEIVAAIERKYQVRIDDAELICFPFGSFYTSVLACVLPRGIGRAVADAGCPKVYVPNTVADPEQLSLPVAGSVERLLAHLRRSGSGELPTGRLLDLVLVDTRRGQYPNGLDVDAIERLGVRVLDVPLVSARSAPLIDPRRIVEALLSLI